MTVPSDPSLDRLRASIESNELLTDEGERRAFKLALPGIRRDLDGHRFIQLDHTSAAPLDPALRRSDRMFLSSPIGFEALSATLSNLRRGPEGRYLYGSAGAAYPVQVYLHVEPNRVTGVPAGAYYYHPIDHRLIRIDDLDLNTDVHFPINRPWVGRGAVTLFVVADLAAIAPLYGKKARDFSLIEAGLVTQLLESTAPSQGVGLCSIGLIDFDLIRPNLALTERHELVHTLVAGSIEPRVPAFDGATRVAAPTAAAPSASVAAPSASVAAPSASVTLAPSPVVRSRAPARAIETTAIEDTLSRIWRELLQTDSVDVNQQFFDIGATSLMAARAIRQLHDLYPAARLDVADIFSYPTIYELAGFISERLGHQPAAALVDASPAAASPVASQHRIEPVTREFPRGAVAIVSMAGRFAGSRDLDAFWRHLEAGDCLVGELPPARAELVPSFAPRADQSYIASYLDDVEQFDPLFFQISPAEAERIDPSHRIMLELCTELLAQAGYAGGQLAGTRTGVFVGATASSYNELLPRDARADLTKIISGNMPAIMANRVSHFFDFRGPSATVNTACSSSLVAVENAVRSVLTGDADLAIAAGVNLLLSAATFDAFRQDGMESPTQRCRTFDAGADGFVRGEGAAAILVKPLDAAMRDRDTIHAVIRGAAVNHDGRTNSLPVPSPKSQQQVIELAHRRAGTSPRDISYVEAHGTGTKLGDPIELKGLTAAFESAPRGACPIGSVKTNIGHLEYAAGIAGLVKTVLALQHETIPASLHFQTPNPHLDLSGTPFFIADRNRPWPRGDRPRLASVSSFGVGGTNAHVIIEEAPTVANVPSTWDRPAHVLLLSANSGAALDALVAQYLDRLAEDPAIDLADVCHTAACGRPHLAHRLAIVATSIDQLADRLNILTLSQHTDRLRASLIFRGEPGRAGLDRGAKKRLLARASRLDPAAESALAAWSDHPFVAALTAGAAPEVTVALASLDRACWVDLVAIIAELFTQGIAIDFATFDNHAPRAKVSLPGIPFERRRCWIDVQPVLRSAVPMAAVAPVLSARPVAVSTDLRTFVLERISESLKIDADEIDVRRPLIEMGMDSVTAVRLIEQLEAETGAELDATFFFDNPTVESMVVALVTQHGVSTRIDVVHAPAIVPAIRPASEPSRDIAMVGMAGRFPGADDLDELWRNLAGGVDAITEIPPERWDIDARFDPDPEAVGRTYGRWGGFIGDIEGFDPLFFRISDREARWMDPQQRLLLETAWHALEDAGYAGRVAKTRTGVFVGASYTHFRDQLGMDGGQLSGAHIGLGNHNSILANRLSYFLDVTGPCLTVDTLCSSSLVALSVAMANLRSGVCDQAIVAGVHVGMSPLYYEAVSRLQAISPRGRCRTFDHGADGYVPGEGVGVVVLRRVQDALRDGDRIRCIVKGAAVNHGGQSAGLTVPNPAAQASVIRDALADAGVDARSIGYLEAHGTGTSLGDPIELKAIDQVFSETTADRQFCAIGSVKTNIGHLEPAAGVAGLIKVALMLEAGQIPPTLHLDAPNPQIRFESTPCYVVDRLRPWVSRGPRRGGISSFGLGGANAHVVVEQAPASAPLPDELGPQLFLLSARSEQALAELSDTYVQHLRAIGRDQRLADICYTAATGRAALPHRRAIVASSKEELRANLVAPAPARQRRAHTVPAGLQNRIEALPTGARAAVSRCVDAVETKNGATQIEPAARGELLAVVGELFIHGFDVDLESLEPERVRRRVRLPAYPFERRALSRPERVSHVHRPETDPDPVDPHPLLVTSRPQRAQGDGVDLTLSVETERPL